MKSIRTVIVGSCLILFLSLNADAGRKRISDEDLSNVFTEADIEKEIEFGRNMAAQLLADYELVDDLALIRYVNLVGNAVLQNASRQEIKYYFGVIKSKEINAYATPGGYIFITTAAFNLMQSEAELAAVLAHEIAHVVERHIVKVLKLKAEDDSVTRVLGQLTAGSSATAETMFNQAMGKAFDILFSKGLKIEDEFGADKLGLLMSAMAGYDAMSYFDYLERIQPLVSSGDQQVLKTHPPIENRISSLKASYKDEGLFSMGGNRGINRLRKYKTVE